MVEGLKLDVNLTYEKRLGIDVGLCDLSWAASGEISWLGYRPGVLGPTLLVIGADAMTNTLGN